MKLTDYLTENKLSPAAFAALIGADSRATVNRYCTGARIPTREMMQKIADATDGKVTPNDFYGLAA